MPGEKKDVKGKSLKALEKLGHKNLALDEYESVFVSDDPFLSYVLTLSKGQIASEVIHPDDIHVGFSGMSLSLNLLERSNEPLESQTSAACSQ